MSGLISGHRRPRPSLIAARIGPEFEDPCLFKGTCDTEVFNAGLQARLYPPLTRQHLVIMNNAAFYTSPDTVQLIEHTGVTLLLLPLYSPDRTPIEHDFAAITKHLEYHEPVTLDQIVTASQ